MKSQQEPQNNRLLLVSFGIFQTIAVSGIMYGWAGVAGSLLIAPSQEGGVGLTLNETTAIFAMLASTSCFSPLLLGIVLDKYGPRVASITSNVIVAIGIQLMALSDSFLWFAVGACTVAFGGPGIQASIVSFCNLFPQNQFFVLGIVNGSISLSFAILPIFGILWETYGVSYQVLFQSYLVIVILSGVGAFVLMPDEPFEMVNDEELIDNDLLLLQQEEQHDQVESSANNKTPTTPPTTTTTRQTELPPYHPTPEQLVVEATQHTNHLYEQPLDSFLRDVTTTPNMQRHESFLLSKKAMEKGQLSLISLKDLPFSQQVTSGSYARCMVVFVVTSFFANFYIATITTEFADFVYEYTVEEQHKMTNTFSLVLSFGIFGSFVAGYLMDVFGLETCTLLTLLLGILHMTTLLLLGNDGAMTIGFVVYTLFRQFLFPVFIASLSAKLGFKYFGILSGLAYAASGVSQLCIAPLAQAVQGTCHLHVEYTEHCSVGQWKELHVIQILVLVVLGILPIWDHRVQVQRQEALMERIRSQTSMASSTAYGSVEPVSPPVEDVSPKLLFGPSASASERSDGLGMELDL